METNREQGPEATLNDLNGSYNLLVLFQKADPTVTIPEVTNTLRKALS